MLFMAGIYFDTLVQQKGYNHLGLDESTRIRKERIKIGYKCPVYNVLGESAAAAAA